MCHNKARCPQDHNDFSQLGRLERKTAYGDPALCSVVCFTKELHEKEDKNQSAIQKPVKILDPDVICYGQKQKRSHAENHTEYLLGTCVRIRTADDGKPDHCEHNDQNQQRQIELSDRI